MAAMEPISDHNRPPGTSARIPARTRSQAMDWSLVLASQGIETLIEEHPESGWGLVIAATEQAHALSAIEQYHRENRHWPWQREVREILFDWAASLWVVITCVFFQFQSSLPWLTSRGAVDSVLVARGEWWRCFTATTLHGDLLHLATNSLFGLILLGFAMGRFGTGLGLMTAYLAGVVGNLFSLALHPSPHHSLGASGVVMGALGMLAAQSLWVFPRAARLWKISLGGLVAGTMLFVLLGLHPDSDIPAHLGGFLAGIAFGGLLAWMHRPRRNATVDVIAGAVFVGLLLFPWWLAARGHW